MAASSAVTSPGQAGHPAFPPCPQAKPKTAKETLRVHVLPPQHKTASHRTQVKFDQDFFIVPNSNEKLVYPEVGVYA